MSKVKVASITIEFQDGQLKEMSVDDARELCRQLRMVFSQAPAGHPIVIERDQYPNWRDVYGTPQNGQLPCTEPPAEQPRVWCSEEWTKCNASPDAP